jgi:hypothetical protein
VIVEQVNIGEPQGGQWWERRGLLSLLKQGSWGCPEVTGDSH